MADNDLGFGMRPASHRVERFCDACGQVDDHPHHVAGHPDGTTTDRHMDCCQAAGCPDGTCNQVIAKAGDKRGSALIKHIAGGGADHANYSQEK